MKYHRAEQIFHAPTVIEVMYEGQSIWISELHPEDEMVVIKREKNDKERESLVVSPIELTEGNIISH